MAVSPEDVEIFTQTPDFHYYPLCDIRVVRVQYPFNDKLLVTDDDIRVEAAKCGANGFIYGKIYNYTNQVTISGKGIKIYVTTPRIKKKRILKIIKSVRTNNLKKLKELIKIVPPKREKRSPGDSTVLDNALYWAAREGFYCNKEIVNFLLYKYESIIPNFKQNSIYGDEKDVNVIYCRSTLPVSYARIPNKHKFAQDFLNYLSLFLLTFERQTNKYYKLIKYKTLTQLVTSTMQNSCKENKKSELCRFRLKYLEQIYSVSKFTKKYFTNFYYYREFSDIEKSITSLYLPKKRKTREERRKEREKIKKEEEKKQTITPYFEST